MLLPARDVRSLPTRLPAIVRDRLQRAGIDGPMIDAEIRAMSPVVIAPTTDRSVVGIMVDFAMAVPYHLEAGQWTEATLRRVEERLAKTPCQAGRPDDRVIFPDRKAPAVLQAKWMRPH